jgi:hypothetical protein
VPGCPGAKVLVSRVRKVLQVRKVLSFVLLVIAVGAAAGCGDPVGCYMDMDGRCPPGERGFDVSEPAEAVAEVIARCDQCAWETAGREAVMLRITLDGRYVQHLPVSRQGRETYRVMLGSVPPGTHVVRAKIDRELTAQGLREEWGGVESIEVRQIHQTSSDYRALSLAPFVYARPDTVGRFTDVPLVMWYEVEPEANATRYRYSVIFTNEDGGTPTDRLMATWGRTTDIEYLYSVAVDASGAIVDQDMQGPDHETLKYNGRREGQHPLLWVSTENNMVLDRGETQVRFGPAPLPYVLTHHTREIVMDGHPWLYDVMSRELQREGKIVADAPPGHDRIPDPRRFVFLQGCGEAGDRAVAFAIGTVTPGGAMTWHASDRGMPAYRIVRNGCYQVATPLPGDLTLKDVRAVRVQAYAREGRGGTAPARLTKIQQLFMLDERHLPAGASVLSWVGNVTLEPGTPFEIPIR